MSQLAHYALPAIVLVSALGAIVMCALVVRYGFADALDDEQPEARVNRVLRTRLGHAFAGVCFAVAAVLATLVMVARPAPPAPAVAAGGGAPAPAAAGDDLRDATTRLTGEIAALERRLAATPAPPRAGEPAASPPSLDATAAPALPRAAERAGAPPAPAAPRPPAPAAVRPSPAAPRILDTEAIDLPPRAAPAPEARAAPARSTPAPAAARVNPRAPAAAAGVSAGVAVEPAEIAGGARALTTTIEGVRVEMEMTPAGAGARYTVRLFDAAGRPLPDAAVTLQGRASDGTTVQAPLERRGEPGVYRADLVATPDGPRDWRLRVVQRDKRFEIALGQPVTW